MTNQSSWSGNTSCNALLTTGAESDLIDGFLFFLDPIFEPEGFDQTFAEMDKQVKNTISHR